MAVRTKRYDKVNKVISLTVIKLFTVEDVGHKSSNATKYVTRKKHTNATDP